MKASFLAILLVVLSSVSLAQQRGTSSATTKGACSPAVTGSHNSFTLKCEGVPPKLADEIASLVNKLAQNESDAQMILDRLNGCVASVKVLRENQQPWRLTQNEEAIMQTALSGESARVDIHILPNSSNPSLLGSDLYRFLKGMGWEVSSTTDFTLNPDLVGVYVVVVREPFPVANKLNQAFNIAGIESHLEIDPAKKFAKNDNVIYLIVGHKPRIK